MASGKKKVRGRPAPAVVARTMSTRKKGRKSLQDALIPSLPPPLGGGGGSPGGSPNQEPLAAPEAPSSHLVEHLGPASRPQMVVLPLQVIHPNPNQPRKTFPERHLKELANSIRAQGLVQPIVVRQTGENAFEIVAGERRYRAFQALAGEDSRFESIPAVVQDLDDHQVRVASLVENVIREDLNPLERAEALIALKQEFQTDWEGIAQRVGVTKRAVLYLAGTLKLRKEFKEALRDGKLTEKHTRALRKLGHTTKAAYDLFEYLLAHQDLSADTALDIAGVLKREPGFTAEGAHLYLQDEKTKAKMPSPRKGPEATPYMQVVRGLKTFLKSVAQLKAKKVPTERRVDLKALVEQAMKDLKGLLEGLE